MLAEGLVIGVLLGLLLRGNFKSLERLTIKFWYLIVFTGILEITANYIRKHEIKPFWELIDGHVFYLKLLIYGLLIFVLVINHDLPGFKLTTVGVVLNAVVVLSNKGRMPVSIKGIEGLIKPEIIEELASHKDLAHVLMDETTVFPILGDVIHLMSPYPFPKSISIGDIIMSLGIIVFVVVSMKRRVIVNG